MRIHVERDKDKNEHRGFPQEIGKHLELFLLAAYQNPIVGWADHLLFLSTSPQLFTSYIS